MPTQADPSSLPACEPVGEVCPYAAHSSAEPASVLGQAACVMVGTRVHASAKHDRRRLGSQALHWGVLFVAILLSLPIVLPTLSEPMRGWIDTNILHSPGNWKSIALSLLASSVFSVGFVHRVGRDRVQSSCAMLRRLGPATILWSGLLSWPGLDACRRFRRRSWPGMPSGCRWGSGLP